MMSMRMTNTDFCKANLYIGKLTYTCSEQVKVMCGRHCSSGGTLKRARLPDPL